jgi:hypothetical protein
VQRLLYLSNIAERATTGVKKIYDTTENALPQENIKYVTSDLLRFYFAK